MRLPSLVRPRMLWLVGVAVLTGCAELRPAREELRDTGQEIGHATRDAAREIGPGVRQAVKDVGREARAAARELGHATRDTVRAVRKEAKKAD